VNVCTVGAEVLGVSDGSWILTCYANVGVTSWLDYAGELSRAKTPGRLRLTSNQSFLLSQWTLTPSSQAFLP
jgi:hypothetical protein